MLKRMIAAAILASAPLAGALADDDIGCGAGTIIWEGQEGLVPKVLGATTNGSFGNQTFGISTGTLGCSSDGVVTADARTGMFASANLDQIAAEIAAEIAAGEGETLDALATLYEIDRADRAAFAEMAQASYASIFDANDVTVADVLAGLESAMAQNQSLSRYV